MTEEPPYPGRETRDIDWAEKRPCIWNKSKWNTDYWTRTSRGPGTAQR